MGTYEIDADGNLKYYNGKTGWRYRGGEMCLGKLINISKVRVGCFTREDAIQINTTGCDAECINPSSDKFFKDLISLFKSAKFCNRTLPNNKTFLETLYLANPDLRTRRRRMAQREFSSRRDSPVMTRLLQEIVRANQKHNELN